MGPMWWYRPFCRCMSSWCTSSLRQYLSKRRKVSFQSLIDQKKPLSNISCNFRLYYPVAILKQLWELYPDKFIGVLYDIGCHLGVHIVKVSRGCIIVSSINWLVSYPQRRLFPQDELKMMFGTSVFHAYVHQWACQIKYHPCFNEFWGLSDGEGLERLWSFLSALVAPLRISTRLHRLLAIHWRALFYASRVKEGSGNI